MNSFREYPIQTLYLKPTKSDPWLNRLTAMVGEKTHGKGFCHAEICIPNITDCGLQNGYISSSIYNGEGVTANRVKTFANPGYEIHTIIVNEKQLQRISDGINDAMRREIPFDGFGMYMSVLPFRIPGLKSKNKTFCSRYITELLQMGGVLDESIEASITTPSKLYKIMKESTSVGVVGSVSHKEGLMLNSMTNTKLHCNPSWT
jgi:hypothetical protein